MLKKRSRRTEKLSLKLKKIEESITNRESNENTEMQERVMNNVITSEDAAKVVQEFEEDIKSIRGYIMWLTYHRGWIFHEFKEKERFVSMVSKFDVSKSTIVFKIALVKLTNNYPKMKSSSLSFHYFQKKLKKN